MNWYSFIFSDEKRHRLQRHLLFWLLWWVYFTASSYHYEQSGLQHSKFEPWNLPFFIKSMLLLAIHMCACYYIIYYVIPKYLLKRKYKTLAMSLVILAAFILFASYFVHSTVMPFINSLFNYKPAFGSSNIWWTSIVSGLLSAPKVISAAAVILLLKRWYLKQKEKEKLEKEKLVTDLQLLKAQMHPEFLFSSLDNIHLLALKKDNTKAAALLLRLADILSYILYESENKFVPLEKEITIIKDYLLLEKTRMNNKLELDIAVKGTLNGKFITPLLLFSLIENSFLYSSNENLEANWMNIEFQIEEDELIIKLIHGKSNDSLSGSEQMIMNATKRLDYFYSGNYEFKTTIEPDMMMIYLKIGMERSTIEMRNNINKTTQITYATN